MRLNHRLTVQRPDSDASRNASNEINLRDSASWETLGRERWGQVKPLTGSERVNAYGAEQSRSHTVYLRYDVITAAIDGRYRLLWHLGTTTRILAVVTADDVDGAHQWIKCNCIEVLT